MANTVMKRKALSVSPLKVSQTVGGALAFLGLRGAIPLMHGAQGCTAFAKVFFVRHFREPVPLQTTAMDQVRSVMGADDSIVEALATVCKKNSPRIVGVVSTGLSEAQGCHLEGALKAFRREHPEYAEVKVVVVHTPDFAGCFESGYARAVMALIESEVPESSSRRTQLRTVNVLASSMLTTGDLEEIEELVESFGLDARILPHLGESLGGELIERDLSPTTIGGTDVKELGRVADAQATLVIGESLRPAGELLQARTGVPSHMLPHLHDLQATDQLVSLLLGLSGLERPPRRIERQRRQLTDAMLDTHFFLGKRRVAIGADSDLLRALTHLCHSMGVEVVAAVTPHKGPALKDLPLPQVQIGDLEDLEQTARRAGAHVVFGSSHAVDTAARLGLPLVRVGFPLYDEIGAYSRRWVGYRGIRQVLFELANTLQREELDEVEPYVSRLSQKAELDRHDAAE